MKWNELNSVGMLDGLIQKSFESPIVLFKHSSRCPISAMALNRIGSVPEKAYPYIVDVVHHRNVSGEIARRFEVAHQSPQMLIIHKGKCHSDSSHLQISAEAMEAQIGQLKH